MQIKLRHFAAQVRANEKWGRHGGGGKGRNERRSWREEEEEEEAYQGWRLCVTSPHLGWHSPSSTDSRSSLDDSEPPVSVESEAR